MSLKNIRWQRAVGIDVCTQAHKTKKWVLEGRPHMIFCDHMSGPRTLSCVGTLVMEPIKANVTFHNEIWKCRLHVKWNLLDDQLSSPLRPPPTLLRRTTGHCKTDKHPCFYFRWKLQNTAAHMRSSRTPPEGHVACGLPFPAFIWECCWLSIHGKFLCMRDLYGHPGAPVYMLVSGTLEDYSDFEVPPGPRKL